MDLTATNDVPLRHYIVTLDTPDGVLDVEVPTFGPAAAAARRAKAQLFMATRKGTPDDYVVLKTVEGTFPEPRS